MHTRQVTQGSHTLELDNDLQWVQGDLSLKDHNVSISAGSSSQLELVEVYPWVMAVVLSVQAMESSPEEAVLASQGPVKEKQWQPHPIG